MKEIYRNNMEEYYQRSYKDSWVFIRSGLRSDEADNCFWLQGPSGYLLKTNGVCWGVDLVFHNSLGRQQIQSSAAKDLNPLRFIIITHQHSDHFDTDFINCLKGLPIQWLIPAFLREAVLTRTELQEKQIIWMHTGDTVIVEGITITAFNGFHWAKDKTGCPSLGYFVDTGRKRILFPGDVREYHQPDKPFFKDVDCLFAHVWLGAGNALNFPWEGYLQPYCDFMSSFRAKKMMLTHLYDTNRSVNDIWTYSHCGAILDEMTLSDIRVQIEIPIIGRKYFV